MGLITLLLKTNQHKKLFELLWQKQFTASVREFSLISGLPYATTHDVLLKLKKMGLVQKKQMGSSTLYKAVKSTEEIEKLKNFLHIDIKNKFADYKEMDLPLIGEFNELNQESAQSKEELLVKTIYFSKKKSSLLRTLPLLVHRLGTTLDINQLIYWSKKFHVNREIGFIFDVTSSLSKNKKFNTLANKFKDKRWSKPIAFLDSETKLNGFQELLMEANTPALAKKWYLKLNMGMDSFASHYFKFTKEVTD